MLNAARIAVAVLALTGPAFAAGKSPQACLDEYAANRPKIEGAQSEADFIAACRKGQEIVTGATSVARPAVPPATAAQQPATPAKSAGEAVKPAATP